MINTHEFKYGTLFKRWVLRSDDLFRFIIIFIVMHTIINIPIRIYWVMVVRINMKIYIQLVNEMQQTWRRRWAAVKPSSNPQVLSTYLTIDLPFPIFFISVSKMPRDDFVKIHNKINISQAQFNVCIRYSVRPTKCRLNTSG